MNTISQETLIRQMIELGVTSGGVLLVHTSFSKVKPMEGGPAGLTAALRAALSVGGTLVMPSMSYLDEECDDARAGLTY
jgi:aminoglycoside N3'-acetyltransferase